MFEEDINSEEPEKEVKEDDNIDTIPLADEKDNDEQEVDDKEKTKKTTTRKTTVKKITTRKKNVEEEEN